MQHLMAGRPCRVYTPIYQELFIETEDFSKISMGEILILCPVCRSHSVGRYGSQPLRSGCIEKYQCKNPKCPALRYLRKGKQFNIHTSALFQDALSQHLTRMLNPLIRGDTTQEALGNFYHRSPALMTYIRHKVENLLEKRHDLEKLVLKPSLDSSASMDEIFLKINGIPIYTIIVTGYSSKKVLGIKVALSRDEKSMRMVFDEAERHNGRLFSILTIDAWGGSMKMTKDLGRPIIVVIHKHKSPYTKAVIWKIEYEGTKRIIHKIGVNTNFFKTRHSREYRYLVEIEDLAKAPLKPRGRPKGVRNGQGKGPYKKKPKNQLKKRGPKGLFVVFDIGRKGYAKVDPGKMQVRLAKGGSTTVRAVLNRVILIYGKMTIQNNLAENKNSVLEHRVWRSGPKDIDSIEKRFRTFFFFHNNPEELPNLRINHRLRADLVYKELKTGIFGHIAVNNFLYREKITKMEGNH